ncbi:MAG TPA: SurA N-terminal domain-containing protein, partial [Burkholderiales bacterium]|nr:SurA N-terminal domain-containing protein [Burkholderiales bacterium]
MSSLPQRSLRLIMFGLWLMPALAVAAPAASIATLDRILVVVNDDVVTQSELALRVAETKKQLQVEKITPPPDDVLRRQVLEHLVFERVQLQIASQTGIRVSETEVDKALESVAQQNKMSVEEFQKLLRREGIDPVAHRASLRNQMLVRQLQEREVLHRVAVTDAEVDNFLENQESRDSVNLSFNLSHIFIPVPESASPEAIAQAKGRAEEALQGLRQGGDFAKAAVSFSQGPEALSGGNLGWKSAGQLPDLFLSAIKNLVSGSLT